MRGELFRTSDLEMLISGQLEKMNVCYELRSTNGKRIPQKTVDYLNMCLLAGMFVNDMKVSLKEFLEYQQSRGKNE